MAEILKNYRKKSHLKLKDAALKLGVSKQYLNACESKDAISDKYIPTLCKLYGINERILRKELFNDEIAPKTIQYYRQKAGYSIQELATALNISTNYIYNWEKGSHKPNKYSPILKEFLNIPDQIIYPDILKLTESLAVFEFKEFILVIDSKMNSEEIVLESGKEMLTTFTEDNIQPLFSLEEGAIRKFPNIISNNEGELMIEMEDQIFIISDTLLEEGKKKIEAICGKHIVLCKTQIEYTEAENQVRHLLCNRTIFLENFEELMESFLPNYQLAERTENKMLFRSTSKKLHIYYYNITDKILRINNISFTK